LTRALGQNIAKGHKHGVTRNQSSLVKLPSTPSHEAEAEVEPQPSLPEPCVDMVPVTNLIAEAELTDQRPLPDLTVDAHFIIIHSLTTVSAFHRIGVLLDLICSPLCGFNIRALPSTLPPSIAPTLSQQIIPHRTYVDILPWPMLRDRILASSAAINEDEFFNDMRSLKVWGQTPWDPMSWEMGDQFAQKWWFLLDEGMVRTSNFWRAQRGECALAMAPLASAGLCGGSSSYAA
jgi:hypothetical protein